MKQFNKLVRDHIPEIIESKGETCTVRTLNDVEFVDALRTKLTEEIGEYLNADTPAMRLLNWPMSLKSCTHFVIRTG